MAATRCFVSASLFTRRATFTTHGTQPILLRHTFRHGRLYATAPPQNRTIANDPHPTPRPENIAYFTGNPRYYQDVMDLNALIRKHALSFRDSSQYKSIMAKPKWMTLEEMQEFLEYKLVRSTYTELVHKLNILYTVQARDPDVNRLLSRFVKPGAALVTQVKERAGLDEFGRSYSYGSRKTAKAQAWMVKGDGQVYVNGTPVSDYFAEDVDREVVVRPLEVARQLGKYNVWALVKGGGPSGQAAAVSVAVARGLVIHDPMLETAMKETGLTTIDTRQVERKKTGQPKARKKNTWVKR